MSIIEISLCTLIVVLAVGTLATAFRLSSARHPVESRAELKAMAKDYLLQRRLMEATVLVRKALRCWEPDVEAHLILAEAMLMSGRKTDAARHLARVRDLQPENQEASDLEARYR